MLNVEIIDISDDYALIEFVAGFIKGQRDEGT